MRVVILRHPQEKREEIGTAELVVEALGPDRCRLLTGLSWRNHKTALGPNETPGKWAVAYLGSSGSGATGASGPKLPPGIWFTDKKGLPLPQGEQEKTASQIVGLVFIDGTWSQAKALWWRNAWLLKLRRFFIIPTAASPYSRIRHEPRKECVSTAEAVAYGLTWIAKDTGAAQALLARFNHLTASS
ncbi:MAG: tRNA-uridine aminocarboxypropyltransferase [Bdellovibrionota bacterium]